MDSAAPDQQNQGQSTQEQQIQDQQPFVSDSEYELVEVEEEVEVSTEEEQDDAGEGEEDQEADVASQPDPPDAEDLSQKAEVKLLMESLQEYSKDPLYAKHFEMKPMQRVLKQWKGTGTIPIKKTVQTKLTAQTKKTDSTKASKAKDYGKVKKSMLLSHKFIDQAIEQKLQEQLGLLQQAQQKQNQQQTLLFPGYLGRESTFAEMAANRQATSVDNNNGSYGTNSGQDMGVPPRGVSGTTTTFGQVFGN
ncbi:hypothetical protein GOP47_0027421 [Adiantum capillus-veneris]|nr:hypothetical protein GOP47_0027421 [Adiantum capillus-veneris]